MNLNFTDTQLNSWAERQRASYRKEKLSKPHKDKLEKIKGWEWECYHVEDNKKKLLQIAENGEPRPKKRKHPLGICLVQYLRTDAIFHKKIRDLAPHWFFDSAAENKKVLIQKATNKENKPSKKNKLGMSLRQYTRATSGSYDEDFDKIIRAIRPDWFIDSCKQSKEDLINLASSGSKPRFDTKLGHKLWVYTNKNSLSYDDGFSKTIRSIAPDWFVNVDVKKQQLIALATEKKPRPVSKTLLGDALCRYTNENRTSFDADFLNTITKLRPDWFEDQTSKKKAELLYMAKQGGARPNKYKNKLGLALVCYTNETSGSYDPVFNKKIRVAAPEWFVDTVAVNKQELLKMARNGKPRPSQKLSSLGRALSNYLSPRNKRLHKVFVKQIKNIAPHWFVDTVEEKKKQLIEMAKKREPKPIKDHPLRVVLGHYTRVKSGCYDPDFDKQIRKIAPYWWY